MKVAGIILLSLGALVVVAGLAGTVVAMIRTFETVQAAGGNVIPGQMAEGIYLALWFKVVGLLGVPMALVGLVLLIVGVVGKKRVPTPREA